MLKGKYIEEYFYPSILQDTKMQAAPFDSIYIREVKTQ